MPDNSDQRDSRDSRWGSARPVHIWLLGDDRHQVMFVMKSRVAVLRPDVIPPQPTRSPAHYRARDNGAPGPALWAADRLNAQLSREDTPFGRNNEAVSPRAGLPASQTVARLSWPASADAVSSGSSVSGLFAVAIGLSARSPPVPEERRTERRDPRCCLRQPRCVALKSLLSRRKHAQPPTPADSQSPSGPAGP